MKRTRELIQSAIDYASKQAQEDPMKYSWGVEFFEEILITLEDELSKQYIAEE